jgi:hypothetical protein
MTNPLLTQSRLKELLYFNSDDKHFYFRVSRGSRKAGQRAGFIDNGKYEMFILDGVRYRYRTLVELYETGALNLLHSKNKSSFRGVCKVKAGKKFKFLAQYKRAYLGLYSSAIEASMVYEEARDKDLNHD